MEEEDEKELEKYILGQYTFERLPPEVRRRIENSRDVWREKVIKYSIKHQLRWKNNLVKTMFPDERSYYLNVLKVSKEHFMVSTIFLFSSFLPLMFFTVSCFESFFEHFFGLYCMHTSPTSDSFFSSFTNIFCTFSCIPITSVMCSSKDCELLPSNIIMK